MMRVIYKKNFYLIVGMAVVFGLFNCANQPVEIEGGGLGYHDDSHSIKDYSAFTDSTFIYHRDISSGTKTTLILGELNGQKCSILLKFADLPQNAQILSASLTMIPTYLYPGGSDLFEGTIRLINDPWHELEAPEITYGDTIWPYSINYSEVDTDYVEFPIGIVQSWTDTSNMNNGVILSFENAGFAKQYNSDEETTGFTFNVKYIRDETDTITSTYQPFIDTYIVEGELPFEAELYITNYGVDRMIMKFDLDSIPDNSFVNYAELTLTLDPDRSYFGMIENPVFEVMALASSIWEGDLEGLQEGMVNGVIDEIGELKFNMTEMVQIWMMEGSNAVDDTTRLNYGVIIRSLEERLDLSHFVFFNSSGNYSVNKGKEILNVFRPRLFIAYTEFKPK